MNEEVNLLSVTPGKELIYDLSANAFVLKYLGRGTAARFSALQSVIYLQ